MLYFLSLLNGLNDINLFFLEMLNQMYGFHVLRMVFNIFFGTKNQQTLPFVFKTSIKLILDLINHQT